MIFLLFLAPFFWGIQKRDAAAPKASGCFMGGTCAVREEPGKQKPRSCRAQEFGPKPCPGKWGRKGKALETQERGASNNRPDARRMRRLSGIKENLTTPSSKHMFHSTEVTLVSIARESLELA